MSNSSKILKQFKMNDTAKYSITRPYEAEQISKQIINTVIKEFHKIPEKCTLTDGTACVGGDSVNLSKYFGYINAVELDPDTYKLLLQNLNNFDISNIKTYNEDYTHIMHNLQQDIIYFDPPWGGINYKDHREIELKLSGIEIGKIIQDLFDTHPTLIIFLKAPINVKKDTFKKYVKKITEIYNKVNVPSFILIKLKM